MRNFPSLAVARLAALSVPVLSSSAMAQLSIPWWTIDCGGITSSGGPINISGAIGQHDAGAMSSGAWTLQGGFWGGADSQAVTCYANCDGSTTPPVLNVADFTCFLQKFAAADSYANCDASTVEPVLNVADFTCFLQRFASGCGS